MTTYRAYQVTGSRQFELVDREKPAPGPGQVGIKVLSCGVCHTDFLAAEGLLRDPSTPIVPGHEIVGVIDAVGDGVTAWQAAAIARGTDKQQLAARRGADHYADATADDPGTALLKLGGADAIVATAASGASMTPLIPGLRPGGRMVVVGAGLDPITVSTLDLIFGTRTITGSKTGSAIENEDNLAFSARHGIKPMMETMPLPQAPKPYHHIPPRSAPFRFVITLTPYRQPTHP